MTRQEQLCIWLQTLPPREEHVLRLRFGIQAEESDPLRPKASTAFLTAEQVQQFERQGLRQLRKALPMVGLQERGVKVSRVDAARVVESLG